MAPVREIGLEGELTGHHGASGSVHTVEDDEAYVLLALASFPFIVPLVPDCINRISPSSEYGFCRSFEIHFARDVPET